MKRLISALCRLVIILVLFVAVTATTICGVIGYVGYKNATADRPVTQAIGEVQAQANYTPLENIPVIYKNAVIAIEDHRFYDHGGFDVIATARALLHNALADEVREGGSTITQQLAKNLYFDNSPSFTRKLAELFVARAIEKEYSKDQILAAYINCIYYGDGYYNIYDASMGYFGVMPAYLSDDQATLLAGVPNAPSLYAPTVNLTLARERQQQVLRAMIDNDMLTREEANLIAPLT
ncbi:MAG: biosynthetic peptidoglycan transglycosylase [Peptococcaceae bacterium]|jgi:membrane peptidoglycan carboxypeptidase